MAPAIEPARIKLQKDELLHVEWSDGRVDQWTIAQLRGKCPCAMCKENRQEQKKNRLAVISGNSFDGQLIVTSAKPVGNYAIHLTFSDGHDTGIFSFQYLREISDAMRSS
jgi:DUF971 family protein